MPGDAKFARPESTGTPGGTPTNGRESQVVGIGTSIFLIALGAILKFAVNAEVSGLEISTVGVILMIAGVLGLLVSLYFMSVSSRRDPVDRTVARDRDVY